MKNILLYPNSERDIGFENTVNVAGMLREFGAEVFVPRELVSESPGLENIEVVRLERVLERLDLVISLGGDGTLLRCAQFASEYSVPILGVNLGKVGMLAELEPDEYGMLERIFEGKYEIDRRMMICSTVKSGDALSTPRYALNDVVIFRGTLGQSIKLRLMAGGSYLYEFFGDGVIISTPTGSSGYSMSAGGPLVEPTSDTILLTPVCPYASYARSFVLDADKEVEIIPDISSERCAFMTADGGLAVQLTENSRVSVRKAERYTDILRLKKRNFYEIIQEKLNKPRR